MSVLRNLLIVALGVFLVSGCSVHKPLIGIIFPNEWVGDIDKDGFNEPSGICYHPGRKTLFVVGDEGELCEMKTDGTMVKQQLVRQEADFEGVTCDPATGLIYLVIEEPETIVELDPDTFKVLREFSIPREYNGRLVMKAGAEGIEGMTFVPDKNHPQGGVFYIANQSFVLTNPEDISAVFKAEVPLRSGSEVRITGCFEPGIIDLSGMHYDAKSKTLWIVSDATNTIMEYSPDFKLLDFYAFPGDNQEGITADDQGNIYIAQDTGGIIKLKWLKD